MSKDRGAGEGAPEKASEGVMRTGGEDAAKGYAAADVAPLPVAPTMEMETVRIGGTRRGAEKEGAERRGSGPRNPEQKTPLRNVGSGVELPDGLPATKKQRFLIDSELLVKWNEELERKKETDEGRAAETAGSTRDAGAASSRRMPRRMWAVAMGVAIGVGVAVLLSRREGGEGKGAEAPRGVAPAAATAVSAAAMSAPAAMGTATASGQVEVAPPVVTGSREAGAPERLPAPAVTKAMAPPGAPAPAPCAMPAAPAPCAMPAPMSPATSAAPKQSAAQPQPSLSANPLPAPITEVPKF